MEKEPEARSRKPEARQKNPQSRQAVFRRLGSFGQTCWFCGRIGKILASGFGLLKRRDSRNLVNNDIIHFLLFLNGRQSYKIEPNS
jgi:hypothetical protein